MPIIINQPTNRERDALTALWEASVRASHSFLAAADILFYKSLLRNTYLDAVTLYALKNEQGEIAAFMGLGQEVIEMLFVAPGQQNKGYGKQLIEYAVFEKHIRKVDVNEQNEAALRFYKRRGFVITGREATDSAGKPYPILHMQFKEEEPLQSSRLLLRPFAETDAAAIFECCQQPELGKNAGWKPHESLEESKEVLATVFLHKPGIFAIEHKETGTLIGSIGLINDPKRPAHPNAKMIGYWLKKSYWGKGLMTEAVQALLAYGFNTWQLEIITATCYLHNRRSQQVLERNGFIYEGRMHQAEKSYDGHLHDFLCYYLTAPAKTPQ